MIKKISSSLLTFCIIITSGCTSIKTVSSEEKQMLQRQQMDMESLTVYRKGLTSIASYIRSRKDIFPEENTKKILPVESREELRRLWKSVCDYYLAIDSIYIIHQNFSNMPQSVQPGSFNICRAGLLMEYRFAMDFILIAERAPDIDAMLNDSMSDVGLPAETYSSFKKRFLNVSMATDFAAYEALSGFYGKAENSGMRKSMSEDSRAIWKMGSWKGEAMTVQNGFDIIKKSGHRSWFPIQKGISNWAGDTKVYRQEKSLITPDQISAFVKELRPGDIMLERREWYLTNIGIPGFWTHAAIYIGTPEERAAFFNDPVLQGFLSEMKASSVEELLKRDSGAYRLSIKPDSHGVIPRVVEAIGEGVLFTTIEHSADCDSIVVLRPLVSKSDIAKAIMRAYKYSGRPYDFDFDFRTDSSLVCTELVYKSYEPATGMKGVLFHMERIMGKEMLSPNGIAKMYSDESGKGKSQLKFILFYDGSEKKGASVRSTEKSFKKSYSRPKWHILTEG